MDKITFISSTTPEALSAQKTLITLYKNAPIEEADVIVALGGDGRFKRRANPKNSISLFDKLHLTGLKMKSMRGLKPF